MARRVGSKDKKKRKSKLKSLIIGGSLIGLAGGSVYLLSRKKVDNFPGLDYSNNLLSAGRDPINLVKRNVASSVNEKKQKRTASIFDYLKKKGIVDSVSEPSAKLKQRGFRTRMNMIESVRSKYNEIMQQFYKKRTEKIASMKSIPDRTKYQQSTKYYRPDIKLDNRLATTKLIKSAKDIPGILPTKKDRKSVIGFSKYAT